MITEYHQQGGNVPPKLFYPLPEVSGSYSDVHRYFPLNSVTIVYESKEKPSACYHLAEHRIQWQLGVFFGWGKAHDHSQAEMRGHLLRAVRDLCELPQLVIFTAPCRASKGSDLPSLSLYSV